MSVIWTDEESLVAERAPPPESINPIQAAPDAGSYEARNGASTAVAPEECAVLFQEFQPLVRRMVSQYSDGSSARLGLPEEIRARFQQLLCAYDPRCGVALRPYLVRALPAAVYAYVVACSRPPPDSGCLDPRGDVAPAIGTDIPVAIFDNERRARQVLLALPKAISELPLRQRRAIIERYYQACSLEEIAAMLAIQPKSARSLLRRAIRNLRRRVPGTALRADA